MIGRDNCPFCEYARVLDRVTPAREPGQIPSNIVDVDPLNRIMTIRPIMPTAVGHVMLVPFEHVPDPRTGRPNAAATAKALERMMAVAARRALSFDRPYNLVLQHGEAAGQSVEHLHLHYVPRHTGDGLGYRWRSEHDAPDREDHHD